MLYQVLVGVKAPEDFKLRHGANFDRLGFSIALQATNREPAHVGIKYIFRPANGEATEGPEYIDVDPPR